MTTHRNPQAKAAPDWVKRQFTATGIHQLWVAVTTYVPTWAGFLYLAMVVDVYSRKVVGWAFGKCCEEMGVKPSMGTVGDAYDNAMAESFFATLECELIDRRSWKTKREARLAIFNWIESWYNPLRRHSGIGQRSPNAFERSLSKQKSDIDIIEANDIVQEGQNVR